jgi:hypothetical protein
MNIDQRDIEKGALPQILPKFYPGSISYLSELNACRMYAEMWSNKRKKDGEKRSEIGHAGYLKTLEFGESKKRRKVDRVRFGNFIAADSLNYKVSESIYGEKSAYIEMGGERNNIIFNNIIKAKTRFKAQSIRPNEDFHSERYLPEILKLELEKLGLCQYEKTNKHYFEISTNVDSITNENQQMLLSRVLGGEDIFEKLHLLHKVGRKHIWCFFENPENVIKNMGKSSAMSRLCVAWPFHETLVFDFAGIPEDYVDACLFGILIKTEDQIQCDGGSDRPQIDGYA